MHKWQQLQLLRRGNEILTDRTETVTKAILTIRIFIVALKLHYLLILKMDLGWPVTFVISLF